MKAQIYLVLLQTEEKIGSLWFSALSLSREHGVAISMEGDMLTPAPHRESPKYEHQQAARGRGRKQRETNLVCFVQVGHKQGAACPVWEVKGKLWGESWGWLGRQIKGIRLFMECGIERKVG